jgi:hypothetical protein
MQGSGFANGTGLAERGHLSGRDSARYWIAESGISCKRLDLLLLSILLRREVSSIHSRHDRAPKYHDVGALLLRD